MNKIFKKYLKYKVKYLKLKNKLEGAAINDPYDSDSTVESESPYMSFEGKKLTNKELKKINESQKKSKPRKDIELKKRKDFDSSDEMEEIFSSKNPVSNKRPDLSKSPTPQSNERPKSALSQALIDDGYRPPSGLSIALKSAEKNVKDPIIQSINDGVNYNNYINLARQTIYCLAYYIYKSIHSMVFKGKGILRGDVIQEFKKVVIHISNISESKMVIIYPKPESLEIVKNFREEFKLNDINKHYWNNLNKKNTFKNIFDNSDVEINWIKPLVVIKSQIEKIDDKRLLSDFRFDLIRILK